jgi:hypothetical protein
MMNYDHLNAGRTAQSPAAVEATASGENDDD